MKSYNLTLDDLILKWNEDGLKLNVGIDGELVTNLEEEIKYVFSDDFKGYLKRTNGFIDFESDSEFFSFWSADRIKSELKDNHPKELICFSDYWISLCSYGFHKETGEIFSHFQHDLRLNFIAGSFTEFIKLYLSDFNLLLR